MAQAACAVDGAGGGDHVARGYLCRCSVNSSRAFLLEELGNVWVWLPTGRGRSSPEGAAAAAAGGVVVGEEGVHGGGLCERAAI